jgi:CspA family cold shock protein
MTRRSRPCRVSSTNVARNFSRLDRAARFGPISFREDLVFGWLDFPLPEFGLRYQEPPKLGLLPGRTMSARPDVDQKRGCKMAVGTVKFFNTQKGFGFISPSDGGKDVFVHISAVQRAGMTTLMEGQKISYELLTERGKTAAGNLKLA